MDSVQDHLEYEKALIFLVENLTKSGNNPKPVGIHSVLVATRLYRHDYKKDVVVAALLHDIVEDTAVKIQEVKEKFEQAGHKLRLAQLLVKVNSFVGAADAGTNRLS